MKEKRYFCDWFDNQPLWKISRVYFIITIILDVIIMVMIRKKLASIYIGVIAFLACNVFSIISIYSITIMLYTISHYKKNNFHK